MLLCFQELIIYFSSLCLSMVLQVLLCCHGKASCTTFFLVAPRYPKCAGSHQCSKSLEAGNSHSGSPSKGQNSAHMLLSSPSLSEDNLLSGCFLLIALSCSGLFRWHCGPLLYFLGISTPKISKICQFYQSQSFFCGLASDS